MKPLKLSFGIRPSKPMFRLSTIGGTLIEELLLNNERSSILKKLFNHVEQDGVKNYFRLIGEGYSFFVGINDIQYSVDKYESSSILDIDKEAERFISMFAIVNNALKIRDIRRIGIVCEYRIKSNTTQPSKELIEKLTLFKTQGYPNKFNIQFEQRHPIAGKTGLPDYRTEDFWNVIESIYDGEVDAEYSELGKLNMILDVQRYYNPYLDDKADGAIKAVVEKYKQQFQIFCEKNKVLGITNGS